MMRQCFAGAFALFFAACVPMPNNDAGTDSGTDSSAAPTFENVQAILTRTCAVGSTSCHNQQAFPAASLNLSQGNAHAQLVGIPSRQVPTLNRVTAGSPETSYLINKIEGTMTSIPACAAMPRDCGDRMPMISGISLTTEEVNLIKAWIRAGAPP